MDYAVVKIAGKQYRVCAGDVLEVDRLSDDKNLTFDEVLLLVSDGKVKIGKPTVSGASVKATLLDQVKGDKIRVSKFKAKARYRRTIGFRASLSKVQIEKIEAKESSAPSKATK